MTLFTTFDKPGFDRNGRINKARVYTPTRILLIDLISTILVKD